LKNVNRNVDDSGHGVSDAGTDRIVSQIHVLEDRTNTHVGVKKPGDEISCSRRTCSFGGDTKSVPYDERPPPRVVGCWVWDTGDTEFYSEGGGGRRGCLCVQDLFSPCFSLCGSHSKAQRHQAWKSAQVNQYFCSFCVYL
jgi:hypothetical protein